jgi:hypothetical protein
MKQSLSTEPGRQQTRDSHDSGIMLVKHGVADNRKPTAAQRQLMVDMANSPQAIAQRLISQQIHSSPRMQAQLNPRSAKPNRAAPSFAQETDRHGAVTQMQKKSDGQTLEIAVDVSAELGKAIALFEQIVAQKSEDSGKPDGQLVEYLNELKEIALESDESLKAAALDALNEAAQEHGIPLGDISGKEKESSRTEGMERGKVVQGMFLIDYLGSLVGLISAHPYLSAGAGLILAAAIRAVRKRRKLPVTASYLLFRESRAQYLNYLARHIDIFSRDNNVTNNDKGLLRTAVVDAINASDTESEFFNEFFTRASTRAWNNANFADRAFLETNILNPFFSGTTKALTHANVATGDRANFTAALKKLPFVKRLYAGTITSVSREQAKAQKSKKKKTVQLDFAGWKDGGTIESKTRELDDGYNYLTKDRREVDNGNLTKKLREADRFIRLAVEADVLKAIPRPTIVIHLRNSQTPARLWGFRAFQSGGEVHIAQDTSVPTIAHEVGHYIENNLPMDKWAEIHLLLQGRKSTSQKAGYIYPWTLDEQRFPGSYPATGLYTSKYYSGIGGEETSGSTEIMSMSLEYLSDPDRFRTLIEQDPQQAALILRLLRPQEYRKERSLVPFAHYLPD